jgi:hypothetical protein
MRVIAAVEVLTGQGLAGFTSTPGGAEKKSGPPFLSQLKKV